MKAQSTSSQIIRFKETARAGPAARPPAVFLRDERPTDRCVGFFTASIRNRNTRRAYYKAAWREN